MGEGFFQRNFIASRLPVHGAPSGWSDVSVLLSAKEPNCNLDNDPEVNGGRKGGRGGV